MTCGVGVAIEVVFLRVAYNSSSNFLLLYCSKILVLSAVGACKASVFT